MRISDWSSEVCSSDLKRRRGVFVFQLPGPLPFFVQVALVQARLLGAGLCDLVPDIELFDDLTLGYVADGVYGRGCPGGMYDAQIVAFKRDGQPAKKFRQRFSLIG